MQTVEKWAEELSNWGRWGENDELGTLNFITPEKRIQAAALVKDGETVSVSRPVSKGEDPLSSAVSFRHTLSTLAHGGGDFALDRYDIE